MAANHSNGGGGKEMVSERSQARPMRRTFIVVLAAVAALVTSAGPAAASTTSTGGWVPAPTPPFDIPAGDVCDFAVHGEPVVDQVKTKVVATYPDGAKKVELARGALILRITNVGNGVARLEDGSGSGLFRYAEDGSFTVDIVGPLLIGFRQGLSNVPRGLYALNGVYRIAIQPVMGFKRLIMIHGTVRNVCGDFS
jgi:hypothetical protein